jgi:hypothetical protein
MEAAGPPKHLPENTVSLQVVIAITAMRILNFIGRVLSLKLYHKAMYTYNNKWCTICNISF